MEAYVCFREARQLIIASLTLRFDSPLAPYLAIDCEVFRRAQPKQNYLTGYLFDSRISGIV